MLDYSQKLLVSSVKEKGGYEGFKKGYVKFKKLVFTVSPSASWFLATSSIRKNTIASDYFIFSKFT